MQRRLNQWGVVISTALFLSLHWGCALVRTEISKTIPAAELLQTAQNLIDDKKWEQARRNLKVIEENFPSSKEFPKAKLMLADSFFFQSTPSFEEAAVEYDSFLNYFPRHPMKDYALYHLALCQFASIEDAERDQDTTQKAVISFQRLISESPSSIYIPQAKEQIKQCKKRLADHDLAIGVLYLNTYHFAGSEVRLKRALNEYGDFLDLEKAYYYLAEALRQKAPTPLEIEAVQKEALKKIGKETWSQASDEERLASELALDAWIKKERSAYSDEAKTYYQKLVESYPKSEWARRASDRLLELGSTVVKQELDS